MPHLEKLDMTDDVIGLFRTYQRIPLHFYNKDGTILVYRKENASHEEIDRLLRYSEHGIYFNTDDQFLLDSKKTQSIPDGFTATKLITTKIADTLHGECKFMFEELKKTRITAIHSRRTMETLSRIAAEFQSQEDVLTGLVNIIEKLHGKESPVNLAIATKRMVVAMALQTRGTVSAAEADKSIQNKINTEIMLSAMLCDIGTEKMNMPAHREIKKEEMDYIKGHPLLSYLLIAHEPSIPAAVKRNILCHHRPMREDNYSNNYPSLKTLLEKLEALKIKYTSEPGHLDLAKDIAAQIQSLKMDIPHDESANILAIASAFASLTSDVPWRDAYEPVDAVRMIVNHSLFTYSQRTLRDFLDHVAISLCDNKRIIQEGDYVITHIKGSEGKNFFEAAIVTKSDRHQSRPQIDRFASIEPVISTDPRIDIVGFNPESISMDPRRAHFDLKLDESRHIVYIVNKFENEELYKKLATMTGQI